MLKDARGKNLQKGQRVLMRIDGIMEFTVDEVGSIVSPNANAPAGISRLILGTQLTIEVAMQQPNLANIWVIEEPPRPVVQPGTQLKGAVQ